MNEQIVNACNMSPPSSGLYAPPSVQSMLMVIIIIVMMMVTIIIIIIAPLSGLYASLSEESMLGIKSSLFVFLLETKFSQHIISLQNMEE